MLTRSGTTLAALMLAATGAWADEVWELPSGGTVVWLDDYDDLSVFTFETFLVDRPAHLYIPGLPGRIDDRGTFHGYWIDAVDGTCSAVMTGPDGQGSTRWGSAIVMFDKTVFPTGFTVLMGDCLDPPDQMMRAETTFQ